MPQKPDLIITNADVLTMDAAQPNANAVAASQDRILAVGTHEAIQGLAGPDTQTIDGQGLTLLPGLIDSHIHLLSLARTTQELDCRADKAPTVASIAFRVFEWARIVPRESGCAASATMTWLWKNKGIQIATTWTRYHQSTRCASTTAPAMPLC